MLKAHHALTLHYLRGIRYDRDVQLLADTRVLLRVRATAIFCQVGVYQSLPKRSSTGRTGVDTGRNEADIALSLSDRMNIAISM